MNRTTSCNDLAALMSSDALFAVFDVRERGEYNQCQIPKTTSLPRSQIECRIAALVPWRDIPIVVYDEGGIRAALAAATLSELGYQDVSVLDGGVAAWQADGRETASGVNVPSKAFGEKLHDEQNVPELSAEELNNLLERKAELMILDMRTPEEYGRFCIPGGVNVPGGELILWAEDLRHKPAVIVNCAGRTRGIVGAASLRRMGLSNVRALRNGTMGWLLAGFELERSPQRSQPSPSHASRAQAPVIARRIASESSLVWVSAASLSDRKRPAKDPPTYLIDVRSESEYETGHMPGSLCLPGGQAVQRADDFIAVRNARILFVDDEAARAVMTADWFRQMGFPHIAVLDGGLPAWTEAGGQLATGPMRSEALGFNKAEQVVRWMAAEALKERAGAGAPLIFDVGSSVEFAAGHVPGARWIARGWLEVKIPELFADTRQPMIVTCADGRQSVFAARTLQDLGYENVSVLAGGVRAWSAAGCATESGLTSCLVEPNDVVLSPSIRGNREEMRRYLDWELTLKH